MDKGAESERDTAPRHTVMVVDDEKNIRRALGMILSSEGYDVGAAEAADASCPISDSGSGSIAGSLFESLPDSGDPLGLPGLRWVTNVPRPTLESASPEATSAS